MTIDGTVTGLMRPDNVWDFWIHPDEFEPTEDYALRVDERNPLRAYRDRFSIPAGPDGQPSIYVCSHSLGLHPKSVKLLMDQELDNWARLGVRGHFEGKTPWYTYQALVRASAARLVGAKPSEVVLMNGLTINLHLMMATFYRPNAVRYKILMDEPTFPSDLYAVKSQISLAGYDPAEALLTAKPRPGESGLRDREIEAMLMERGREVALVLFSGVNFLTGQLFDIERIVRCAKEQGCVVGLDLAHAVGNVPLKLHDWKADFAVWCNYKYLNCGPGAVAGCFVHEEHGNNIDLPRLAGWWGNNPETRFRMQLESDFVPQPGADGWQVSNPPILALVPIRASYQIFDEVGMPALRARSTALTDYLEYLVDRIHTPRLQIIKPPPDPFLTLQDQRGCQLSLLIHDRARDVLAALQENGAVADFREPNVLRVAPVPLYNTFHEVWRFSKILELVLR
jgi:kynureninase